MANLVGIRIPALVELPATETVGPAWLIPMYNPGTDKTYKINPGALPFSQSTDVSRTLTRAAFAAELAAKTLKLGRVSYITNRTGTRPTSDVVVFEAGKEKTGWAMEVAPDITLMGNVILGLVTPITYNASTDGITPVAGLTRSDVFRYVTQTQFLSEYNAGQLVAGRFSVIQFRTGTRPNSRVCLLELGLNQFAFALEMTAETAGAGGATIPATALTITYVPATDTISPAPGVGQINGNRPIKSLPTIGFNPGTQNITEWIEKVFYQFQAATAGFNGFSTYEAGTSATYTVSGTINPNDETALANRRILKNGQPWQTFAGNTFSFPDTAVLNTTYAVQVDAGTPPVVLSATAGPAFAFPVLYGTGPATFTAANIQAFPARPLQFTGARQYVFTANAERIYVALPAGYRIVSIIDSDNSNVTGIFLPTRTMSFNFGAGYGPQNYTVYMNNANFTATNYALTITIAAV